MTKRRRKKKGHYHTGEFTSTKTGRVHSYRSGWELSFMRWLDDEPTVVTWDYESIIIPYVSNVKSGKLRRYFPDFFITYAGGNQEIVEIKPSKRVPQLKVQKKLLAAQDHCRAHGWTFRIITEVQLKVLGLL